ncbi:replicative DNA helicase [Lacibacter sediminis]|uniref:DNA 5'-3' helicase n=1 Tax=Lacibacter sediminis TaxID=2760713 RepID=A0A7G5XFQ9_9BACT|nr:DnaB-like helicase C-terminal domain-containing protein [Lacibacter sediminis]QNA44312.1 AAA family ATPase [Lacibacter sediminis]
MSPLDEIIEVEKQFLAVILNDHDTYFRVAHIITASTRFSAPEHQEIYAAMQLLVERNDQIRPSTVLFALKELSGRENTNAEARLRELADIQPDASAMGSYMNIIHRKSIRGEFHTIIQKSQHDLQNPAFDVLDLLNDIHTMTSSLLAHTTKNKEHTLKDLWKSHTERFKLNQDTANQLSGFSTGFEKLDAAINGLQPGRLYVIGARPSVGKTAFAINLMLNVCISAEKPRRAIYFSHEMSADQLSQRIMACKSGIKLEHIAKGVLDEKEWELLNQFQIDEKTNENIIIDDRPSGTVKDVRESLHLHSANPIDIVFVDHLQYLKSKQGRYRDEELTHIMKEFKELSYEFKIPIILISQLNRNVETRTSGRIPMLSDLRESGSIEQEADVVMFLYRPEYYEVLTDSSGEGVTGETHLRIAKNRTGILDTIHLSALLHNQRFIPYDKLHDQLHEIIEAKESEGKWSKRFQDEKKKYEKDVNNLDQEDTPF